MMGRIPETQTQTPWDNSCCSGLKSEHLSYEHAIATLRLLLLRYHRFQGPDVIIGHFQGCQTWPTLTHDAYALGQDVDWKRDCITVWRRQRTSFRKRYRSVWILKPNFVNDCSARSYVSSTNPLKPEKQIHPRFWENGDISYILIDKSF